MSPHAPRTDPGGRYSRTGLPPWVFDGEAFARPGMCDARLGKPSILQYGHTLPCHLPLLATPTQRAPPQVGNVKAEVRQRHRIGRDSMIGVKAHHDPPQPRPLLIDRLVHPSTQFLLDHLQVGTPDRSLLRGNTSALILWVNSEKQNMDRTRASYRGFYGYERYDRQLKRPPPQSRCRSVSSRPPPCPPARRRSAGYHTPVPQRTQPRSAAKRDMPSNTLWSRPHLTDPT
jgi:hypothetical protein